MTEKKARVVPVLADVSGWPPPYSVRVSAKAAHARLRVLPDKGLEVVLPRGMDPSLAAAFVDRHKLWVMRALHRVGAENPANIGVPDNLTLHGGTLQLPLCFAGETRQDEALVLSGRREDAETAFRQLRQWVRSYATRRLARELEELAQEHGFRFSGLRFGCQKSRWGSCTSQGIIRLNICLVFLPPEMSRHVLLHELAHTRHCNHGQQFWQTLFAVEPDAMALDKRLRKAWRLVPAWIW